MAKPPTVNGSEEYARWIAERLGIHWGPAAGAMWFTGPVNTETTTSNENDMKEHGPTNPDLYVAYLEAEVNLLRADVDLQKRWVLHYADKCGTYRAERDEALEQLEGFKGEPSARTTQIVTTIEEVAEMIVRDNNWSVLIRGNGASVVAEARYKGNVCGEYGGTLLAALSGAAGHISEDH